MSTTLTNGLKLPDKGSVDWYADMQNNYQILDGAVGTVAEHSTQISGKAPLVHTHVKSDVTDLFNSDNTWSGDQTVTASYYVKSTTWEKGVEPSSSSHKNIYFSDKNNVVVGTIRRRIANGSQAFQFFGSALVKNGQLDPTGDNVTWGFSQVFLSNGSTYFQFDGNIGNSIIPKSNNTYDLGSSSYQWNNLYAQSYYYNGTEFQNKFVTLDTSQTISAIKTITGGNQGKMIFKNPDFTVGTTPESSTTISRIYFGGSASYNSSTSIISNDITSDGYSVVEIGAIENNSSSSNRASLILRYEQDQTRHRLIKSWGDFCPYYDNTYYLGRSDLQWKSVYAVNYYYNGTQWGLDQANVWTGRQTYGAYLKSFGEARTDEWSGNSRTNAYLLSRRDTDDVSGFLISTFRQNAAQGTAGHIYSWDILENSTRYSGLRFTIDWDSTLNSGNGAYKVTLGTNTQGTNPCNDLHITQLKTINGINPGALSLPNINYTEGDPDVYNVGTDLNNLTKNVSDPLHFSWTAPVDGWLAIMWYLNGIQPPYNVLVTTGDARVSKFSQTWSASSARWYFASTFPVVKNVTYYFEIDFQNTSIGVVHHAYLLPCLGNV